MPDPFRGGMSTALEMIQGSCAEHEAGHLDDVVCGPEGLVRGSRRGLSC